MATFTKLNHVKSIKDAKTGEVVDIFKYSKEGTKRIFFALESDGIRLNSKMYPRRWAAEDIAKQYLNRNK